MAPSPFRRGRRGIQKAPPHAWDLLVQFYDMKHGREFNEAPARKLTQSFNLDNIGGKAISSKQVTLDQLLDDSKEWNVLKLLLSTIDSIATSHAKLRRTPDAMFKAFVSAALKFAFIQAFHMSPPLKFSFPATKSSSPGSA